MSELLADVLTPVVADGDFALLDGPTAAGLGLPTLREVCRLVPGPLGPVLVLPA